MSEDQLDMGLDNPNAEKSYEGTALLGYESFGKAVGKENARLGLNTSSLSFDNSISFEALTNFARNNALARNILEVPTQDMLSKGRKWSSDSNEDGIKAIIQKEKDIKLFPTLEAGLLRSGLHGGCAIHIVTNEEDLSLPLDPTSIRSLDDIRGLTLYYRHEFHRIDIDQETGSPTLGEPTMFHLGKRNGSPMPVHPTRLIVLKGTPIIKRARVNDLNGFWGDSVLKPYIEGLISLESVFKNASALVYEAKIGVLKAKDLFKTVDKTGKDQSEVFVRNFNRLKGGLGLSMIDSEWDYVQSNYNFAGLKDIIDKFEERIASESKIPQQLLLGRPAPGLNNSGESAFRAYYDRIISGQKNIISPALNILDMSMISGSGISDASYEWNPLVTQTKKQNAETFRLNSESIKGLVSAGLLTTQEGIEAIKELRED